jgi:hypothetical protein
MGPGGPAGLFAQIAQYVDTCPRRIGWPDIALAGVSAEDLATAAGKGQTRALTMST